MTTNAQVTFKPLGRHVDVPEGTTIMEAARDVGIRLAADCGGMGTCGSCRVLVEAGPISTPTADEEDVLTEAELDRNERLACMTRVLGDVTVRVPASSLVTEQRVQLGGDLEADTVAYIERIAPELVALAPTDAAPLGVAVDLGTTTLVTSLIDLKTGSELGVAGGLNPQIRFGEDVITRLGHARQSPEDARALASEARGALAELIETLMNDNAVGADQVVDLCLVGNTAMTHLLLGQSVERLSVAPYEPESTDAIDIPASTLGLPGAPGASVHILPAVGGFIGADHVAMILATGLDRPRGVSLGIDVGTNTEVVLSHPGATELLCASCASGPAFEGAHIGDGMRASLGAIEHVTITEREVEVATVGEAPPIGLCGTGIVDAVAELLRRGLINHRGRFDRTSPRVREGHRGQELVIAEGSGEDRDIVITQKDVNEVQVAKGAIRAGIDVLLDRTGMTLDEIDEVVVAGGFGAFLDINSALDIGLFPRLPVKRFRQVGNAAVVGARAALVSRKTRARAADIGASAVHVELNDHPKFKRLFALGMLFPDQEKE